MNISNDLSEYDKAMLDGILFTLNILCYSESEIEEFVTTHIDNTDVVTYFKALNREDSED